MYWERTEKGFHLYGESIEELREVLASLEEQLKPPTEAEKALFDQLVENGHPAIVNEDGEIVGVTFA